MIILRQREYTSVHRKIGAKLKRGYVDFVDKMGRGLQSENEKSKEISRYLGSYSIQNPRILKESIKEGRDKYNARTLGAEQYGTKSRYITNREFKDYLKKTNKTENDLQKKLGNAVKSGNNIIFLSSKDAVGFDRGYDIAEHAHEVGHLKNDKLGRKFTIRNNKADQKKRHESILTVENIDKLEKSGARKKALESKGGKFIDRGIGVREYLKRAWEGRNLVKEEKEASKNAMKFLKEHGASSDELKLSKYKLKRALDTYRTEAKVYRRMPLQNMMQIKSRRRK